MKFPIILLTDIFHVGTLDKTKKKNGLEGEGLSISTEPMAWCKINPLTNGFLFSLSKENNKFLDFYSLSLEQKEEIIKWGLENKWIEKVKLYSVTYFDDEFNEEMKISFYNKTEAEIEAENYEVEVEEENGYKATKYLLEQNPLEKNIFPLLVFDLLVKIYSEQVLKLDGVWWNEELDILKYSAPRGVIFQSKLDSWKIVKKSTTEKTDK